MMLAPTAFALLAAAPIGVDSRDREAQRLSLEDFLPAEIEELYRPQKCSVETGGSCTLWVAEEGEPRYAIFERTAQNAHLWREIDMGSLLRMLGRENLGPTLRVTAVPEVTDPATFAVSSEGLVAKIQVVMIRDEALLIWMPEHAPLGTFETLDVTAVSAPPPKEISEIRLENQPDVIDEDSSGALWFSAWGNEIYRIDPLTDLPEPMTQMTAIGTPDGMMVHSNDTVWFASYLGRYLGSIGNGLPLARYDVPYPGGNPAIPCEAPSGNVWTTDHLGNRIMEFDLATEQFAQAIQMPVANAWVTACRADATEDALWMTLYQARSLGRLDLLTGNVDQYPVPCAPAFLAIDKRGIWASCWNDGNIIQFDPASLTGWMYRIPGGSEAGGISIDPWGRIVFSQNALGRVAVLDPDALEVFSYQLPSRPRFKDGMLASRAGTYWVPSPDGRLLGKIVP